MDLSRCSGVTSNCSADVLGGTFGTCLYEGAKMLPFAGHKLRGDSCNDAYVAEMSKCDRAAIDCSTALLMKSTALQS